MGTNLAGDDWEKPVSHATPVEKFRLFCLKLTFTHNLEVLFTDSVCLSAILPISLLLLHLQKVKILKLSNQIPIVSLLLLSILSISNHKIIRQT